MKRNHSEDIEEYRPYDYDHFSSFESEKFIPSPKIESSSDPSEISNLGRVL